MNGHDQRLGDFFTSRRQRGVPGLPTLSVTLDRGLAPRSSLERKTDTNLTPKEHLRVHRSDIAYNMMRMWQGASGIAHEEALVSPAYIVLAPKESIDPVFAAYLFKSPEMIHRFWAYSYGITNDRLRLYFNDFKRVPVDIPPLPEQRKIADILSTWHLAIEKTEALLTNARTQKRALMQSLLTGKRRFPEFEGQEWRDVRLGEVGMISSAGVDKKSDPSEPEVRLLNFLDVYRREFIFDRELDHWVTAPEVKLTQCDVKQGDIFFTPTSETRHEIAIPAVAAEDMPGVAYSYHVVRFRLHEGWDLNFRTYVFQTDDFRRQAYRLGDGSGQRYVISQNNFRNMVVRVPPPAEQERIGALLRVASDEIINLAENIERLRTEKKALMQQLLTGKRRVVV